MVGIRAKLGLYLLRKMGVKYSCPKHGDGLRFAGNPAQQCFCNAYLRHAWRIFKAR